MEPISCALGKCLQRPALGTTSHRNLSDSTLCGKDGVLPENTSQDFLGHPTSTSLAQSPLLPVSRVASYLRRGRCLGHTLELGVQPGPDSVAFLDHEYQTPATCRLRRLWRKRRVGVSQSGEP